MAPGKNGIISMQKQSKTPVGRNQQESAVDNCQKKKKILQNTEHVNVISSLATHIY